MTGAVAEAGRCPGCHRPLPARSGPGRPAAWCSKSCRQAAYRARRNAERAARTAAHLAGRLAGTGYGQVQEAARVLAEAVLEMCQTGDPGDLADAEALLVGGPSWERGVAAAARALAAAATGVAELADQHHYEAAAYQRARAAYRRPELRLQPGDETAPDSVAIATAEASATQSAVPVPEFDVVTTAAAATTKSGPPVDQPPVDVDALFDAVEDVLDHDPGDVDVAFALAVDRLGEVHQAATGDGPTGDLVAAALTVAMTRPPGLPARLDNAVSRLLAAATPPAP